MEVQPDSAISGQDVPTVTTVGTGLGAGDQEAGHVEDRVNGLMSSLGRRTTERDEALAERDRLRQELADLMAGAEPASEPAGADVDSPQLPDDGRAWDEGERGYDEPEGAPSQPPPDSPTTIPIGSVITTPDGGTIMVTPQLARTGSTFAPTNPKRPSDLPKTELEALRRSFADQLPGFAAEMRERVLLRGR